MDENDESLVFVTIWACRTPVSMTSMTSSVERTDLDFKISVALIMSNKKKNTEKLKLTEEQTEKLMLGAAFSSHVLTDYMHV